MNQTQRANKVKAINTYNELIEKGVSKRTARRVVSAMNKASEESFSVGDDNRDAFREQFPKRELTLKDIPNYGDYTIVDAFDDDVLDYHKYSASGAVRLAAIKDVPVLSVEGNKIQMSMSDYNLWYKVIEPKLKRVKTIRKKREVMGYLASPFAKSWLKKMQYTERVDEYGHKFLFIAIKCGYKKISDKAFQKLCNAICKAAYGDDLRMTMWIGGKVNWTMFYQRPNRVDGHETFFCGVVGQDDFSPEDWDKDHSEYSFINATRY